MSVTIYDVAREAGVGISTVSRVLNEASNVRPATRARVLAAIESLGYRPNPSARNLSRPSVRAVAVVLSYLTNPFQVAVLQGIERVLSQAAVDLIIYNIDSHARRDALVDGLSRSRRFDALISISFALPEKVLDRLDRYNIPVVIADHRVKNLPSVYVDNIHGGRLATEHLTAQGHRRIGFIQDYREEPDGLDSNQPGYHRRLGYEAILTNIGAEPEADLIVIGHGHTREKGSAAAEKLLTRETPPTAIFAASDMMALGVLEYARAAGIDVPQDLMVVGFDDIELASFAALTTIRQPMVEMGSLAAALALDLMTGTGEVTLDNELPLTLVVRNSSEIGVLDRSTAVSDNRPRRKR